MDILLTRISIQLEGRKHSAYSSDADLGGTKKLFEKIDSLGDAQYYNLKRLKIGQKFSFERRSFVVTDIELQHSPENQFGDGTDESLDIHIRVREEN